MSRHIALPFDFRDGLIHPHSNEASDLLWSLFPGTIEIMYDGHFLYLVVDPLPPQPLPKTIGGLPVLFFVEQPGRGDMKVQGLTVSVRNGRLYHDRNYRGLKDWTPLFTTVRNHFATLGILITEVMYWQTTVSIILDNRATDMTKVPATLGQVSCWYLFEDQMGRGSHQTLPEHSLTSERPLGGVDCRMGDIIYLDHPNGRLDGSLQTQSFRLLSSGESGRGWILTQWVYMGQDSAGEIPDDVYSTAVRNESSGLVGYCRHAPKEGIMKDWCAVDSSMGPRLGS